MKWRYYVDEYGDRWVDESDHYVIRVNGIGRFYIEGPPDNSPSDDFPADGFDTLARAKLHCDKLTLFPERDDVWGNLDDKGSWRMVDDIGNDRVRWTSFTESKMITDTIRVWIEWVNEIGAVKIKGVKA